MTTTWIPAAEQDMNLLVWAKRYVHPKALDTAPTVVGPGHNGGTSQESTTPFWLSRNKEFGTALQILRYLQLPQLQAQCGVVVRDSVCEHCHNVEPWLPYLESSFEYQERAFDYKGNFSFLERSLKKEIQPTNFAQILWYTYGMHGSAIKLDVIETHIGWQFGAECQRSRWARLSSRKVRAEAMGLHGREVIAAAVAVYENIKDFNKVYRRFLGYLRVCGRS